MASAERHTQNTEGRWVSPRDVTLSVGHALVIRSTGELVKKPVNHACKPVETRPSQGNTGNSYGRDKAVFVDYATNGCRSIRNK